MKVNSPAPPMATLAPRKTVVSAFLDGRAENIETCVLSGVSQFREAHKKAGGQLEVTIDGIRQPRWQALAKFTAKSLLPAAASVAAGIALSAIHPVLGYAVAGAGVLGFSSLGARDLAEASAARQWPSDSQYSVGENLATPAAGEADERLLDLIDKNQAKYPGQRHLIYFSGHGDDTEVASLTFGEIQDLMQERKVTGTVLDACLGAQLESLVNITPWSQFVLASTHEIPAKGMPIARMFSPENLQKEDDQEAFIAFANSARRAVPSLAVIHGENFQQNFLPKFSELGDALKTELKENGCRGTLRRALARSKGPEWFQNDRVDMGSFLKAVSRSGVSRETRALARETLEAYQSSVPYTKNSLGFTFDLNASPYHEGLPQGWRDFLGELDMETKPWFPFF